MLAIYEAQKEELVVQVSRHSGTSSGSSGLIFGEGLKRCQRDARRLMEAGRNACQRVFQVDRGLARVVTQGCVW